MLHLFNFFFISTLLCSLYIQNTNNQFMDLSYINSGLKTDRWPEITVFVKTGVPPEKVHVCAVNYIILNRK